MTKLVVDEFENRADIFVKYWVANFDKDSSDDHKSLKEHVLRTFNDIRNGVIEDENHKNKTPPNIFIGDIEYTPADSVITEVSVFYMFDNHSFLKLKGRSIAEIINEAESIARTKEGSWGGLCPASLLCGKKEVDRVGKMVHARSHKDFPQKEWTEGIQEWYDALMADERVTKFFERKLAE